MCDIRTDRAYVSEWVGNAAMTKRKFLDGEKIVAEAIKALKEIKRICGTSLPCELFMQNYSLNRVAAYEGDINGKSVIQESKKAYDAIVKACPE